MASTDDLKHESDVPNRKQRLERLCKRIPDYVKKHKNDKLVEKVLDHMVDAEIISEYNQLLDEYEVIFDSYPIEELTQLKDFCQQYEGTSTDVVKQELDDADDLIKVAKKTKPVFDDFLNGIVNGMDNCKYSAGPLKQVERILEKAENDYSGDVSRVLDIVRSSIICRNVDQILQILEKLNSQEAFSIARVKNGLTDQLKSGGYRDLKANISVNGHICELQLHLKAFFDVKQEKGHALYNLCRVFSVQNVFSAEDLLRGVTPEFRKAQIQILEELERREPGRWITNLAICYGSSGEPRKSLPLYEQQVEYCRRNFGDNSESHLVAMSNLAICLKNLGEFKKALPLQKQVFEVRMETLGEDHPDTLSTMASLGLVYKELKDFEKSQPLYERCLELRTKRLGKDHPDRLDALNNLAILLKVMKKYKLALPMYIECYEIRKARLGDDHAKTLRAMNNLAVCYKNMKNYDAALPLYLDCLAVRRRTLGNLHPDTLTSLNTLGLCYQCMGRYEEGIDIMEECLKGRDERLGTDHPRTLTTLQGLIQCYEGAGRTADAEKWQQEYEVRAERRGNAQDDIPNAD